MNIIISPHYQNGGEGEKWLPIQNHFIQKYTKEKYQYVPIKIEEGIKHIKALKMCLEWLNNHATKGDLILEMDSDAFPISDNWISYVKNLLSEGYEFVAVQRLENPHFYKDVAHPCFASWIHGTKIEFDTINNNPYIVGYEKRKWKPLLRSNRRDLHRQMFGIYGIDGKRIVYHHGCGSRSFRVSRDPFFIKGVRLNHHFHRNPELFVKGLI